MKLTLVLWLFLVASGSSVSDRQEKKLVRIAQDCWESKTLKIEQIGLRDSVNELLDGFYFKVTDQNEILGYMGGKRIFDSYLNYFPVFLFDKEFKVIKAAVVEMNTIRGAEITSKRWLRQFVGYQGTPLRYGKEIDAISGATLSGISMVKEVQLIRQNLKTGSQSETGFILGQ